MENELMHYGVKGMKWGVIRTPEQLGHKIKKAVKEASNETKKYSTKKRNIRKLSDSELADRIKRLKMEAEYTKLASTVTERSRSSVNKFLRKHSSQALDSLVTKTTAKLLDSIFNPKEDGPPKIDFDDVSKVSTEDLANAVKWLSTESAYLNNKKNRNERLESERAAQEAEAQRKKAKERRRKSEKKQASDDTHRIKRNKPVSLR